MQQFYKTKKYGDVEVIGLGSKYNYYTVRFLQTGNIGEYRKDAVERGEIRDKYAITLCGVGAIGNIKTRGKYKRYYTIWRNMIMRCYHEENKRSYFGKVIVCDRWKTFEYFYDDIQKIDGWDQELFDSGKLVLDKNIKQRHRDTKVYSKDTCKWVDTSENSSIQDAQQKCFIAIAPDGQMFNGDNITAFGREHGLERKQISAVLHGRFKTTMGWKFYYVDEEIV